LAFRIENVTAVILYIWPDATAAPVGWWTMIRLAFVTMALLVAAYAAGVVWLFFFHHEDKPRAADAMIVLAGTIERLPEGLRLVRQGYAHVLVVSLTQPVPSPSQLAACNGHHDYRAICFRADPYSTRGEAREIGRLARIHGWRTINVVTSHYHVVRARVLIARCYHGDLRMVGVRQSRRRLPIDAFKESLKLIYAETIARGC
jgi:uncharacterized SAM-binding protein YcdF (DUF218 family)